MSCPTCPHTAALPLRAAFGPPTWLWCPGCGTLTPVSPDTGAGEPLVPRVAAAAREYAAEYGAGRQAVAQAGVRDANHPLVGERARRLAAAGRQLLALFGLT